VKSLGNIPRSEKLLFGISNPGPFMSSWWEKRRERQKENRKAAAGNGGEG